MAVKTTTSATKVPARSTDIRERNISGLMTSTATPGSVGPTISPQGPGATELASKGNTGATVGGQMVGNTITAENSLRDKRLDFNVGSHQAKGPGGFERVRSKKTTGAISAAFKAQQPQMMQQFKDESRALVQRTAAMGRTGSGLFNRDTGFVGDRALQAREALLGNLAWQATQADANRALQAAMGNQSAGVSMAGIGAQTAQANASRAMQADILRQQHAAGLQSREDMLAQQAIQNQNLQAMLLGQGFNGAPTGAAGLHAGTVAGVGSQHGANAAQLNNQAAAGANQAAQSFAGLAGGGAPQAAPMVQPNVFQKPQVPEIFRGEGIGMQRNRFGEGE
jgi:hypothetical protein